MLNGNSNFSTDKQTVDDLQILGRYNTSSLYALFRKHKTKGADQLLESYFQQPLGNIQQLLDRQQKIKSFIGQKLEFPVEQEEFGKFELFVHSFSPTNPLSLFTQITKRKAKAIIGVREELDHAQDLILGSMEVLVKLRKWFIQELKAIPSAYTQELFRLLHALWEHPLMMKDTYLKRKLSLWDWYRIERFLRCEQVKALAQLIHICHELDVFMAVAKVAETKGLIFPEAQSSGETIMFLEDAFHPMIPKAIGNTLDLKGNTNLLFLTGANMAGKSTWMKTLGVCFYLAHMGFPVSAKAMRFSIFDGIFTSINLPDNIQKGYSHFYAEVMRVKDIATEVASGKKLLVVFDELFKGTNVKDAYDATLQITKALTDYRQSLFIISTHIVEVGEALKSMDKPIQYRYMPTVMSGNKAHYPYRLAEGVSDDRHGMMIIREEGILDLFDQPKLNGK